MPHVYRFFLPAGVPTTQPLYLPETELHHALRVVRVRPGDQVELFDGQGGEWRARVTVVERREVALDIESESRVPEPPYRLMLAQAFLHQTAAMEELVRRGTELGVTRFTFFGAARSERRPKLSEKWQRMAIESCKQCGRSWLPSFQVVRSLADVLGAATGCLLIATKDRPASPISRAVQGRDITLIVGPEGDFTPEELELAARATPVSLGPYTFRSEVAAAVGATLILNELGAFQPPAA